jgi:hypothetical protein
MLSGFLLLRKLKDHVHIFYQKVKGKVLFATLILSLSILVRAVINLVRSFTALEQKIYQSQVDNTNFAPVFLSFYFVFSDVVPLLSQLLSMVFGLIRKNEDKESMA